MIKIGGATVNQIPFDWSNNSNNIIQAIEEAKRQKIRIVCFPELSLTGYGCEDLFLSDWLSERALVEIQTIVKYTSDITVSSRNACPVWWNYLQRCLRNQ